MTGAGLRALSEFNFLFSLVVGFFFSRTHGFRPKEADLNFWGCLVRFLRDASDSVT